MCNTGRDILLPQHNTNTAVSYDVKRKCKGRLYNIHKQKPVFLFDLRQRRYTCITTATGKTATDEPTAIQTIIPVLKQDSSASLHDPENDLNKDKHSPYNVAFHVFVLLFVCSFSIIHKSIKNEWIFHM